MQHIRNITPNIEFKDLSVIFQKLFLGSYLASAELMFKVILHLLVFLRNPFCVCLDIPVVVGHNFAKRLRRVVNFEKLSCIGVTVKETDVLAIYSDFVSYPEAKGGNELARSICFEDFLSFEELALWNPRVFLFGLVNLDGVVFKVVKNNKLSKSMVFYVRFCDAFFEIPFEMQDMSVHFHPVWLVQFFVVMGSIFGHVCPMGR